MSEFPVGALWTPEVTLTERTLFQVKTGGPVLVALATPVNVQDGFILRAERELVLEVGQKVTMRTDGLTSAVVYRGPFV